MQPLLPTRALYVCWTALVMLGGGILMSYHVPFQAPGDEILTLAPAVPPGHWRESHFLSPSCACSQRVLQRLATRGPQPGVEEQVVMVEGPETPDPDGPRNLQRVQDRGFAVVHINSETLPAKIGLVGVPLLVVVTPESKILYRGGYGPLGDQDTNILTSLRSGHDPHPLPLMGCAVSQRLRARVDPFRMKYRLP